MCGRYAVDLSWDELVALFGLADSPPPNAYRRTWNAAPTQDLPVIRWNPDSRRRAGSLLRWGLVPHWARDAKGAYSTINARAETAATAPAYRTPFARRRCLVPVGGFYEWSKNPAEDKQPYYITGTGGAPLALAGLWDGWKDPASGEWLRTFSIVTTTANAATAGIHERLPVILPEASHAAWLGETRSSPAELQALLRPAADGALELRRVGRAVGNVRNDGPELIEAA